MNYLCLLFNALTISIVKLQYFLITSSFSGEFCKATESEIKYYENLIKDNQKRSDQYVFKTDARQYYCNLEEVKGKYTHSICIHNLSHIIFRVFLYLMFRC